MEDKKKNSMKEEEEEDRWSQLPTLLLWMVKELSNFADNVRLASVCKNWQFASLSYPPKPRQNCVNPWIMHHHRPWHKSESLEFTNPISMEKLVLDHHPDINETTKYLFSRRGWLLLRQLHSQGFRVHSTVLLNLHTNAKIKMPDPGDSVYRDMASFSSIDDDDDTPQCVVYAEDTSLYIARVGDMAWTKQSYENQRSMEIIASVVIRGDKVYLMDLLGKLLIYDMTNFLWKTVVVGEPEVFIYDYQYLIMESEEGEILKINQGKNFKTFSFFKLNEGETDWEELNHLEGRRWFLCSRSNHFSAKETGGLKKVHMLIRYFEGKYYQENPMVEVHNQDGTGSWVDFGWMDKVPPSCKRYFP